MTNRFETGKGVDNKDTERDDVIKEIWHFIESLPVGSSKWPEELVEKKEEHIADDISNIEKSSKPNEEKIDKLKKVLRDLKTFIKRRESLVNNNFVKKEKAKFFSHNLPREKLQETSEEILKMSEDILNDPNTRLGEGRVASVHNGRDYPEYCFKIIVNEINYESENKVNKESEFLDQLADLNVRGVRVPKPYYYYMSEDRHLLVMETLDAVALSDILENIKELPENFDEDDIFSSVREFIVEMNKRGIRHCDISAGNIMVDRKTRKGYIIDFGRSKYDIGDLGDDYIERSEGGKVTYIKSDIKRLRGVEIQFKKWKKGRE